MNRWGSTRRLLAVKGHRTRFTPALLVVVLLLVLPVVAIGERVTIQLATYGSLADEWLDLAGAFNSTSTDIQLEVQVYPFAEYVDKILIMVASGTPPDIFQTWAQYKPQWVGKGMLEDLTDRWNSSPVIQDAEIYPFMLDAASYDGRIYGVPYDYNSTVYFVNRDLLGQAGLTAPQENWTIDDLRDMARKMTNENWGTYGVNHGVDFGWGFNIQWFKNWAGHSWLNEAQDEVLVNSPASLEMLQWWYENQYHYQISPRPGSYPSRGGFEGGGYGFYQGWMDHAFNFPEPPAYDWELALYPAGPAHQGNFAQGHMFSIPFNTPNKDAAWKVLEWMASYEGQATIVKINRRQPIGPYRDLWDLYFEQLPAGKGDEINRWVLGVLYGKGYADNLNYWTTFPEMNEVMIQHMGHIYAQGRPIGTEMQEAARRMQGLLDDFLATQIR